MIAGKHRKSGTAKETASIDTQPDAWERFERAVDVVAKSKPRPKRKPDDKHAKSASKKGKPAKL